MATSFPLPQPVARSEPAPARERVVAVDATRGLALFLMLVDHAATYAHVNVCAESYAGHPSATWGPGWFLVGLLTNVSAPVFWFLTGTSIALLGSRERRRGETDRFLLVRGVLLILLDLLVVRPAWEPTKPTWAFEFDLLTCLGVAVLFMIPLRRLRDGVLAPLTWAMFAGYALLIRFVSEDTLERLPDVLRLFVTHDEWHAPQIGFPVLGWLPLTMAGLLVGRHVADGRWATPRACVRLGLGALAVGLAIRLASPEWRSGGGLAAFFTMQKGPPALDYLMINLAVGLIAMAGFFALRPRADRGPWRWAVALGQVPLFLFVVHLPIAFAWARILRHVLPHADAARYALTIAASLATLVPLARWYRKVKQAHRESVLKYC